MTQAAMTHEVVRAAPRSCTLYELEDSLKAWVNSLERLEEEASQQHILTETGQAVGQVREKRDAAVAFLRHCQDQEQFADGEIQRLKDRKAFIARARGELEAYLVQIVRGTGCRGVKRLEGNLSS